MTETKEIIDFNSLFRCKGTQKLWIINSQVGKSGMVSIREFLNFDNTKVVNAKQLVCLGGYKFFTLECEVISIAEVFNNLNNHFKGMDINSDRHFDELMSVMLPNYDPDEFKKYHAVLVLKWYKELKHKLEEIDNGGD